MIMCLLQGPPGQQGERGRAGPSGPVVSKFNHQLHHHMIIWDQISKENLLSGQTWNTWTRGEAWSDGKDRLYFKDFVSMYLFICWSIKENNLFSNSTADLYKWASVGDWFCPYSCSRNHQCTFYTFLAPDLTWIYTWGTSYMTLSLRTLLRCSPVNFSPFQVWM